MLTAEDAQKKILKQAAPLDSEKVPLARALGRVLFEDLRAGEDSPAFPNAARDGYAVRRQDVAGASPTHPVPLPVQGTAAAGQGIPDSLAPGHAMRIMTGAPVPLGADAVIMKEEVRVEEAGAVRILRQPKPGDFIRLQGEDVRAGNPLVPRGRRLRPYEIALLAGQGISDVPVVRRPVAAVVVTGDEVAEPGTPVSLGQIRDANGPALLSALAQRGVAAGLTRAKDSVDAVRDALAAATRAADLVIVSGGVSVGDFDCTRPALAACGFEEIFWKVAIRPGQPLLFGTCPGLGTRPCLVFGLPGNPLSSLVCFEEFVVPALEALEGIEPGFPQYALTGRLLNSFSKPATLQQYVFCRAFPGPEGISLMVLQPQGSAMIRTASSATALAVARIGVDRWAPGDMLPFRWLL
jgi:molybdopterin molybdotransferase